MNWYLWLAAVVVLLIIAYLTIIRDAITIDKAKASAAVTAFLARFKRGGS